MDHLDGRRRPGRRPAKWPETLRERHDRGNRGVAEPPAARHPAAMGLRIGLLRHGLASGQESTAPLLGAGREAIHRLAGRLAREGFRPVAAFSSPHLRARDTARLLLDRTAPHLDPVHLTELTPDADPREAWQTLASLRPATGDLLVVSHLPLIARLAREITGGTWTFSPGTWLEIAIDDAALRGTVTRRLAPEDTH